MNNLNFEEIINFSNKYNYENIKTLNKNISKVFKIKTENKIYILKINKVKIKEEFNLISTTINLLNKNKFQTPKLIKSEYMNNQSNFLFEFIKNEIEFNISNEEHINQLIKCLNEFYYITKDIKTNKTNSKIINILKKVISENIQNHHIKILKKSLDIIEEYKINLVLTNEDINPSNIIINENKIYFIDFDELQFSEIEEYLAKIYLKFIPINENLENKLEIYSNILKNIKFKYNLKKIIEYIIILLYQEYFQQEKNNQQVYLKLILQIYNNKKTIICELEK